MTRRTSRCSGAPNAMQLRTSKSAKLTTHARPDQQHLQISGGLGGAAAVRRLIRRLRVCTNMMTTQRIAAMASAMATAATAAPTAPLDSPGADPGSPIPRSTIPGDDS